MDKLRPAIAWLKKYYFWVCAVIVILVGIGGWYMSTSTLDEEYADRKSEIETRESSARQIANTQNHPNTQYEEEMQTWLTQYRDDIDQAWQKKWEAQQKVLTWPPELNVGRTNFADAINGILLGRPIEALTEEDKELPVRLRELYRDYIKEELPKLAEIIHARWAPSGGNGGDGGQFGIGGFDGGMGMGGFEGGGPGGRNALEKPPLVIWNPSNQTNIQSKSFDWSGNNNGNMGGGFEGGPGGGAAGGAGGRNVPTTKEVLYAQENLWVLENIMNVIAKTNGEISSAHQATIKAIDTIEFGREVMPIRSKVVIPRSPLAAGADEFGMMGDGMMMDEGMGMDGMGMDGMGMDGMGMDGMGMGPDGMGMEGMQINPGDFRYVDKDYKKLMVEDLRAATTDPTSENYYLSVAKRLPIRLRLLMDQREIDKLLVECGNADLMIEVRQVRVNPQTSGVGGGMEGGMGGGGMGGFDMAGMGGGGDFGGMGMEGGRSSENLDQAEKIFDAPVEIYGIIYIYNPVNRDLLWPEGSRPVDESTTEEASTETASVTATTR